MLYSCVIIITNSSCNHRWTQQKLTVLLLLPYMLFFRAKRIKAQNRERYGGVERGNVGTLMYAHRHYKKLKVLMSSKRQSHWECCYFPNVL